MEKATRRTEVFRDASWTEVRFEDLHSEERFRLFDPPNDTPVTWEGKGEQVIFIAKGQPYFSKYDQTWVIDAEPEGGHL